MSLTGMAPIVLCHSMGMPPKPLPPKPLPSLDISVSLESAFPVASKLSEISFNLASSYGHSQCSDRTNTEGFSHNRDWMYGTLKVRPREFHDRMIIVLNSLGWWEANGSGCGEFLLGIEGVSFLCHTEAWWPFLFPNVSAVSKFDSKICTFKTGFWWYPVIQYLWISHDKTDSSNNVPMEDWSFIFSLIYRKHDLFEAWGTGFWESIRSWCTSLRSLTQFV